MRLRLLSRVIVLALVVLVGTAIVVHNRVDASQAAHRVAALQGTDLGMDAAPRFALTDQSGQPVSLQQLKGHPVVLTFLYTHCPDACPLTAEKLHTTAVALGPRAADVRWLAVSIDPKGDTPASATQFVATHHLTGTLHFLLGTQEQLAPIWNNYHIAVLAADTSQNGAISHGIGIYLLDAAGHERIYLGDDFDPAVLSGDLRTLLEEGAAVQ